MNLEHLREFCVFAERLNVSETAKMLNISQPTLSNHIASLEKETGAALVVHGRHPRLTQAGLYLVAQSTKLLQNHEECISGLQEISRREMSLSITVIHSFSGSFENLKTFLARFLWDNPNIYLNEPEPDYGSAYEILTRQKLDAASVSLCPLPDDVQMGVIFRELPLAIPYRLSVWVDRNHPLAEKPSLSWLDLDGTKMMFHSARKLYVTEATELFRQHEAEIIPVLSARSGTSFLQSVGPQDLLLMDEYYESMPVYAAHPSRVFRRINEPDAFCRAYLAYLPDRVTPSLDVLLNYLESNRDSGARS